MTYTGKTLIVKNLLISLCGYEIEMRGIPEKQVKEITTLVWGFTLGGGIDQIDRNVCWLGVENGGMGMINMQEFIDSNRIKLLYRIVYEPLESWNSIGKYQICKLVIKFNEKYFICKCSNVSTLHLNTLPIVLQNIIQSWSKLHELIQLCNNDIDSVLKTRIFCNSSITFKNKSIVFTSFLQSNLRTINDIWDSNNKKFKSCHDIYNLLIDRRNCISEFSKIKKK